MIIVHDLPSDVPGLTWKEKNLAMKHQIPMGTLVEVKDSGIRLFVCAYQRDCDGTPLYGLTWDMDDYERFKDTQYRAHFSTGGYSKEDLLIIGDMKTAKPEPCLERIFTLKFRYVCSECKCLILETHDYCVNCGAKIKWKEDDGTPTE